MPHDVFVAGGTGYIGLRLIPALLARGHRVRALSRKGSAGRLPPGCESVPGNALDAASFAGRVAPADTFVQLVGVPHPSPAKAEQFRRVDLVSVRESAEAAARAGVSHFGLVTLEQMVLALAGAVEDPPDGIRILDVPGIRPAPARRG